MRPRASRILVGAAVWAALAGLAAAGLYRAREHPAFSSDPPRRIFDYATRRPFRVDVEFPPATPAMAGDPVCMRRGDAMVTVGQVRRVFRDDAKTTMRVELFEPPAEGRAGDFRFTAVPNPRTPAWVLNVLLNEERKARLLEDLRRFAASHQEQIFATFWPPFEAFLRDAFRILGDDLPEVLEARDEEVQRILNRHKNETFEEELLPVLKAEVWPTVRERSAPLMEDVGREIWARMPVWQLGWRYFYQQVPFTDDEILERRWQKFLDEEAIPVLESHTEDFLEVVRVVVTDMAQNPRMSAALRSVLSAVVDDPVFADLMRGVFSDLLSPEGRILLALRERFTSPVFVDRLNNLLEDLGPTLNRTANRILLDESGLAINPDLAKVLRTQILWKDACWVLLETGGGGARGCRGTIFSDESDDSP